MLYDNFRAACAARGTNLTDVLVAIGRATGVLGNWKQGAYPNLKIAMQIADHLHITLDELCYGPDHAGLSQDEAVMLSVFRSVPEEKRAMCIDFLKTHAAPDAGAEIRKEA